jgi:hypothetical protein
MYNVPFLEKTGLFTSIDVQFAGFMGALATIEDASVCLAAALASRNIRNGGVCFDLAAYAGGQNIEKVHDRKRYHLSRSEKMAEGSFAKRDCRQGPVNTSPWSWMRRTGCIYIATGNMKKN